MELTLCVPQGHFKLQRMPRRKNELLRAWDAADEYLLEQLAEEGLPREGQRPLILNDGFGALSTALHPHQPVAITDSWLSHEATRRNLGDNDIALESVSLLDSLSEPQGLFDLVLIKVPKTLALLEEQLIRLRPHIHGETRIIAAGMVKSLPASAWQLMARLIGPTTPSKARKKARLIFCEPDLSLPSADSPYPSCYALEGTNYTLCNHANLFSRESLDIGSRFLLQHMPETEAAVEIIDLACGNGVLGIVAAMQNPEARLRFVDESYMAVASAEENFRRAFGESREAEFRVGDGLSGFDNDSADLILCNPPFHQQHAVGDQIAQSMFRQSRRVLRQGGELWVVANRHLGYHQSLKKRFGNVEVMASNAKFVILRSSKHQG